MKKRLISILLPAALAVSVIGCGSSEENEQAEAGDNILHYGISVAPANVDPTNLQEIVSYEMVRQCYNGLTDREESGKLKPGLAESWDTEDDGKTWHFKLREGVKFHSGKELTAEDVKFTFEYDLDPDRASSSADSLMNIEGADAIQSGSTEELAGFEIINDYEFNIQFETNEAYFPEYCSVENLYIVDKSVVEEADENWWKDTSAGTGPYKVTDFKADEKVVMEANKDYYDGAPEIAGIEFIVVEEDSTAMAMYENDELDVISAPWAELETIAADDELSKELVEYAVSDMTYLGMTQSLYEPFQDIRVRQAISLVISPDTIAEKIMAGTAYPLYGIIPVGFNGCNEDLEAPEYDPEKARELLKEAGYDEADPLPEVTLYYLPMDEDNAVYISEQLKNELNWEVKLESPDRAALLDDLFEQKCEFFIFGNTASYGDPRALLEVSFAEGAIRNFSGYINETQEQILEQTAVMTDGEARNGLYQEAEQAVMDDYGFIPMYTDKTYLLVKPEIKGMKYSGLGMDIMDKVSIDR